MLESLLSREPDAIPVRMLLISVLLSQGHIREAATHAISASQSRLEDVRGVAAVTQCLIRIGEMIAAKECLARFEAQSPELDGPQLRSMASTYQLLGDNKTALQYMTRAGDTGYDNADFRYFHGLQLQFNGQLTAARQKMSECLALDPHYGRAALALARLSKDKPDAQRLAFLDGQVKAAPAASEQQAALEFARFEELDSLDRCADAFVALRKANAIMHLRLAAEYRVGQDVFEGLKRVVTKTSMAGAGASVEGPTPIFIVGMPRSGTTLLERMLGNHPDVVSAGELNDFPLQLRWAANQHGNQIVDGKLLERVADIDYRQLGERYLEQTQWRAGGKAFYVDKLPPNHLLVGLIQRALPQAKILHLVRSPMDVCFSNYKVLFGNSYPFSYDLGELIGYYRQYSDLMRYWHELQPGRLLDVPYQQLVAAPEATLKSVFDYCGLRPIHGCSDISRNQSSVATLSSPQVRQPIHQRGINHWQRYAANLTPIAELLQTSDGQPRW